MIQNWFRLVTTDTVPLLTQGFHIFKEESSGAGSLERDDYVA